MRNRNYIPRCSFSKWVPEWAYIVLVALLATSCDDVFEEDLSDRTVLLIAPQDSLLSGNYTQTFLWEEDEDAFQYQLQIVRPSFTNIEEFVLDSLVASNQFTFTLFPGTFQWRVRSRNGSSSSPYFTRTLFIDSTVNLIGVLPNLRSPVDNLITNDSLFSFSWDAVINATSYDFRLVSGTDFETGVIEEEQTLTNTSTQSTVSLAEGTYIWGIRAENDVSRSRFSTRTIQIDRTAPTAPILTNPTNNQNLLNGTVQFQWQASTENANDSLLVASDLNLSNLLHQVYSDSASYTLPLNSGTYYWSVTRTDPSGNQSQASPTRRFTVQ